MTSRRFEAMANADKYTSFTALLAGTGCESISGKKRIEVWRFLDKFESFVKVE